MQNQYMSNFSLTAKLRINIEDIIFSIDRAISKYYHAKISESSPQKKVSR